MKLDSYPCKHADAEARRNTGRDAHRAKRTGEACVAKGRCVERLEARRGGPLGAVKEGQVMIPGHRDRQEPDAEWRSMVMMMRAGRQQAPEHSAAVVQLDGCQHDRKDPEELDNRSGRSGAGPGASAEAGACMGRSRLARLEAARMIATKANLVKPSTLRCVVGGSSG